MNNNLTPNKNVREYKEMQSLFSDPAYFRQAWKSVGMAIAMQPAVRPIASYDKNGDETYDSMIQSYSYNRLAADLSSLCKEKREPTELEMILHCQMIKARTDTSAATFIRDTLGAKPVDESKVQASLTNPYENLTDEELEALQQLRSGKTVNDILQDRQPTAQLDSQPATQLATEQAQPPTAHIPCNIETTVTEEPSEED